MYAGRMGLLGFAGCRRSSVWTPGRWGRPGGQGVPARAAGLLQRKADHGNSSEEMDSEGWVSLTCPTNSVDSLIPYPSQP